MYFVLRKTKTSMRRLFTLIHIFLFIPAILFGQELSVQSFYLADKDLTANTPGTMVKDQNGEVCALIKVETTLKGFTFDVGVLGVASIVEQPAEIWVYVPFGIRKITLQHPQLGLIRDFPLPCTIDKGRTYILKLNASTGNREYDSSKKQKMILQVSPTGARVVINGMPVSLDRNGIYEQEVSFGVYDVMISASKYHSERRQIEINDPAKAQRFNINLKQAFGWLQISGSGDEKLSIEGRPMTFVPNKRIELMSGHYKVLLEKPLHQPYERTIEIKDSVVCEIEPRFVVNYRELEFKVYNEAEIWVDDVKVATGSWKGKLEYGTHRIECRKESHRTTKLMLNVDPQTLGPIILESPEPIYGTLIVNSTPVGAEIFVDDKLVGNTPGTIRVLVGQRNVSVKRTGYNTENRNVTIKEDETARVELKLNDIIPITITSTPNATLYIDGKQVGKTPWSDKVIAGEHKIKLQASSFYELEKIVKVNESYKKYSFKLRRRYYYDDTFIMGVNATTGLKDVGVGGYVGGYINNFNVEAHCLYGPMALAKLYWNPSAANEYPIQFTYNPLIAGGRLGYGWVVGGRFRLTPQIGADYIRAIGTSSHGESNYCTSITACGDLKISIALNRCIEVNFIPQYSYQVYQSEMFKIISEMSPVVNSWSNNISVKLCIGFYL